MASDQQAPKDRKMIVSQLIRILKKFPPGSAVWVEGCDCFGEAVGAEEISGDRVLIKRD